MADFKTNVMRILEKEKIPYQGHEYPHDDGLIDGISIAKKMGQNPEQVFKTLVTRGTGNHNKSFFVFVIPVAEELDLKKAARSVGEKSVEMIAVKELLPITGYIRGGCSPIGMKKQFTTVLDETAQLNDTILVSAGKIGYQIEIEPDRLVEFIGAKYDDLTM